MNFYWQHVALSNKDTVDLFKFQKTIQLNASVLVAQLRAIQGQLQLGQ